MRAAERRTSSVSPEAEDDLRIKINRNKVTKVVPCYAGGGIHMRDEQPSP